MKYIKFFMLMVVAVLIASCSSDDATYNSETGTTVGFTSDTIKVKESTGFFNVPIAIEGKRNGDIKFQIEVLAAGDNPATEDKDFMITGKTLTLLNDTTSSDALKVEIKTIDNSEINEARMFKLKIVNLQGAQLVNDEVVVVLRDNDAAFFEKFYGKWTFSAIDSEGAPVERTITITGPSDEEDPDYEKVLTVTGNSFLNVGVALNFQWHFNYSFDTATKKGTLGFVMGELVSSYSTAYQWTWYKNVGTDLSDEDLTAVWTLGEGDSFPTEIVFEETMVDDWSEGSYLWFYQPGAGWWERYGKIKLIKQ